MKKNMSLGKRWMISTLVVFLVFGVVGFWLFGKGGDLLVNAVTLGVAEALTVGQMAFWGYELVGKVRGVEPELKKEIIIVSILAAILFVVLNVVMVAMAPNMFEAKIFPFGLFD